MENKEWGCTITTYCKPLAERIHHSWDDKKGFTSVELSSIETGETTCTYPKYKTHRRDDGLAFNFCPYCGFKYHEVFESWRAGKEKET